MIGEFLLKPAFPKDETINSLLERMSACNRGGTLHSEGLRVLGRNKLLLDGMPCSVRRFNERFGQTYGDENRLLAEHTLFDFYCCGLSPQRVQELRERLINDSHGPTRPARLPLFIGGADHECLHCTDCDETSLARFGFTFVCRHHVAPFVAVCPWHGTALKAPGRGCTGYDLMCRETGKGSRTTIRELAVRISDSISAPWNLSAYHRDEVIAKLTKARWLSENGRCAVNGLLDAFHRKFDDAFGDERLRILCTESRYADAALRALLRKERNLHPVWCVLFKWLVDEVHHVSSARSKPVKLPKRERAHDVATQLEVVRTSRSVRQASKTLDVSINFLMGQCRKHGEPVSTRPKRIFSDEWDRIAVQCAAGVSPADVAKTCSVSLSTVYRISSSTPGAAEARLECKSLTRLNAAREAWLHALAHSPSSTVTQLRLGNSAHWIYLHRHDREWLKAHSPPRHMRVRKIKEPDAHPLLSMASESISRSGDICELPGQLPIRRSAYRLQALTGLSEYALARFWSLNAGLRDHTGIESQISFATRRLIWAAGTSGLAPQMREWRWAKNAGLRVSSIVSIVYSQSFHNAIDVQFLNQCHQFSSTKDFFYSNPRCLWESTPPDMSRGCPFSLPALESR